MIPTSIDGTDITGATIDGTDVQEITVDGDTVFTAAAIPQAGLQQRYRASELNLVNGDPVSTWPDTSANAFDAVVDSGSPTFVQTSDGFAVNFDGNNDYFKIENVPSDNDFSIFLILEVLDANTENYLYSAGYNSEDSFLLFNDNQYGFVSVDGGSSAFKSGTFPTGNIELFEAVREANNNTTLRLDGTQIVVNTTSAFDPATQTHHIGYAEPRNKPGTELDGNIYEILIYDFDLSSSERQQIYNYANAEYGLSI